MKYNVEIILGAFRTFVNKSPITIVEAENIFKRLRVALSPDAQIKIVSLI